MGRLTTPICGLALLILGSLGFFGCSDSTPTATQSMTLVTTTQVPRPVTPTADEIATAEVTPSGTLPASAKLEGLKILAPVGMQLSVAPGAGITFNGPNVSSTKKLLPMQQAGANLSTLGRAVLPDGQVTMTFPDITLTPMNRLAAGSLALNNMMITFSVTGATWTLPDTYTFVIARRNDGHYILGSSIASMTWNAATGQVPPNSGFLTLTLLNDGNQQGVVSRPLTPSGNSVTLTGTNTTIPFNELRAVIVIP